MISDPKTIDPGDAADVDPEIKAIIANAAGLTWSHFKRRHPSQAGGIATHLKGKPIVPAIIETLEADEAYGDLVAATNAAVDVAAVVEAVAPFVIRMLTTVLAA